MEFRKKWRMERQDLRVETTSHEPVADSVLGQASRRERCLPCDLSRKRSRETEGTKRRQRDREIERRRTWRSPARDGSRRSDIRGSLLCTPISSSLPSVFRVCALSLERDRVATWERLPFFSFSFLFYLFVYIFKVIHWVYRLIWVSVFGLFHGPSPEPREHTGPKQRPGLDSCRKLLSGLFKSLGLISLFNQAHPWFVRLSG